VRVSGERVGNRVGERSIEIIVATARFSERPIGTALLGHG
jgi:hypothetical protein